MQRHLYEHFQLSGRAIFLQDTYVTLIDKTKPRVWSLLDSYPWDESTYET